MSDDYGNSISTGDALAAAGTAYTAYQSYQRVAPFIKGASEAASGAGLGMTLGPAAARAAAGFGARLAVGAGASAAAGAASGVAAGAAAGSVVPGIGTVAGAAIGAIAPLIIPHTPLAKPIRAIPLIGNILSPKKAEKKDEGISAVVCPEPGSISATGASHGVTGPEYAASNRADYHAGRGFRR